jgi:hypothetical protein
MAVRSFSIGVLAALLTATQAVTTTFPATVEVDLIFPRNDTYAPSAMFPIVFAFQNAELAPSLDPGFDMTLWDSTGNNTLADQPSIGLQWQNFSGTDPFYVYTFVIGLNTTEGKTSASHVLNWAFGAGNCSNADGGLKFGGGFRGGFVEFTIQDGAQKPDLVAATTGPGSSSCSDMTHFAFNLTGTLDVPIPKDFGGRNTCAVFSDVSPVVAGNPCAVQVSHEAASSISAALTATACAAAIPGVTCNSTSAGTQRWETGRIGYAAALSSLLMISMALICF